MQSTDTQKGCQPHPGGFLAAVNAGQVGRSWVARACATRVEIQLDEVRVCYHHAHKPATASHSIVLHRRVIKTQLCEVHAFHFTPTNLQQPVTALCYTDVL